MIQHATYQGLIRDPVSSRVSLNGSEIIFQYSNLNSLILPHRTSGNRFKILGRLYWVWVNSLLGTLIS
jgi:hypothetical protein